MYLKELRESKRISPCSDDIDRFVKEPQVCMEIVSDNDDSMGIVCLGNMEDRTAEFFLSVSDEAKGRGYAWFGLRAMLDKAFREYALETVYWCVPEDNVRAIKFCEKHNFHRMVDVPVKARERHIGAGVLRWFSVLKGDDFNIRETVAGCKVKNIRTISTVDSGELSFFETAADLGFDIRRVYYISKVPEGVKRGFHAHKRLKQLLFCPYGRIQLVLENGDVREEIELSDPSIGVVIEKCTWREMLWLQKDSVLCVAASEDYDAEDYIRDYEEFRRYVSYEK